MLKGAVGRRYARAIFDIAVQQGDLDAWLTDLLRMHELLSTPQVAQLMENPKVSFEAKKEIVDRALPGLGQLRRNLLYLLISRRRTEIVASILAEFEAIVNEHRGVAFANVTTAVALTEAEATAVADKLSALTGKQVLLRTSVDPSIIGGLVARIGDRLLDGSVKGRLIALRERLAGAAV